MIDSRFDPRKWPGYLMAPLDGALLTIEVLILGFATVVMVSASPERLDTLALNVGVVSNAAAPFGGWKLSGIGREGGAEGIHEYLSTKYTLIPVD